MNQVPTTLVGAASPSTSSRSTPGGSIGPPLDAHPTAAGPRELGAVGVVRDLHSAEQAGVQREQRAGIGSAEHDPAKVGGGPVGGSGSTHQLGLPSGPLAATYASHAARSAPSVVCASWTTVPCASLGCRNASCQRGSERSMPTGVKPASRAVERDVEIVDLEREVVRAGAGARDEAREEVVVLGVPRFEQLDLHAAR